VKWSSYYDEKKEKTVEAVVEDSGTAEDLYQKVSEIINKPKDSIRIWLGRYLKAIPYQVIPCNTTLASKYCNYYYKSSAIFVQYKDPSEQLLVPKDNIIIFVKFFISLPSSSTKSCLQYLGSFIVDESKPISSIFPEVTKRLHLDDHSGSPISESQEDQENGIEYNVYLESINGVPTLLDKEETFSKRFISSGDVLNLEVKSPEMRQEIKKLIEEGQFKFELQEKVAETQTDEDDDFWDQTKEDKEWKEKLTKLQLVDKTLGITSESFKKWYQTKHLSITFAIASYDEPKEPLLLLKVVSTSEFQLLRDEIVKGLHLDFDPEKDSILIFLDHNRNVTSHPLDESNSLTLSQELASYYTNRVIFFKLLKGITKEQSSHLQYYRVTFTVNGITPVFRGRILASKRATFGEIIESLKKESCTLPKEQQTSEKTEKSEEKVEEKNEEKIRIEEIFRRMGVNEISCDYLRIAQFGGGVYWNLDSTPEDIIQYTSYPVRIDIIPMDQRKENMKEGEELIEINKVAKDVYGTWKSYGDPFMFKILPGEQFKDTKERLMKALECEMTNNQFKKVTFFLHRGGRKDKSLDDDTVLSEVADVETSSIYMAVKKPSSSTSYNEGAVKIYN